MYNKTWISIKNQLIKLLTVQEFLQFPSSVGWIVYNFHMIKEKNL